MKLEETLVSFETAKLAKKVGLPKPTTYLRNNYYTHKGELNGDVTDYLRNYLKAKEGKEELDLSLETIFAPSQSLLQKWLREEFDIDITIFRSFSMEKSYSYTILFDNGYDEEFPEVIL